MTIRLPSAALLLFLGGSACAEDAPAPLPALFATPDSLCLTEVFAKDQDAGGQASLEINGYTSTTVSGLNLNLGLSAEEHWHVLQADTPRLLEATTSLSESLLSTTQNPWAGRMHAMTWVNVMANASTKKPPVQVMLSMLAPLHPASALAKVVAIADLMVAKDDSLKTTAYKLTDTDADPLGIPALDFTVHKSDGTVVISYGEGAFDIIKSLSYLDDAGATYVASQRGVSYNGKKASTTLTFGNANITTISIEYFSGVRKLEATFELDNLPIVGMSNRRDLAPRRAISVREVSAHPAAAQAAPPAQPAPAQPAPVPPVRGR